MYSAKKSPLKRTLRTNSWSRRYKSFIKRTNCINFTSHHCLTCEVVWQSLDAVAMLCDVHDGDARYLNYGYVSSGLAVTRGHYVATVLCVCVVVGGGGMMISW